MECLKLLKSDMVMWPDCEWAIFREPDDVALYWVREQNGVNGIPKDLSRSRVAVFGVHWRLLTSPIGQEGMDQVYIRIWYVHWGIVVVPSFVLPVRWW
jgi:hypothetical protein